MESHFALTLSTPFIDGLPIIDRPFYMDGEDW